MDISVGGGHGEHAASHVSHIDEERKVRLGMFFYIITDIIFALFIVIAYIFLRGANVSGGWFPAGTPDISFIQPTIFTVILVLSGIFYAIGQFAVGRGNQRLLRIGIGGAAILWLVAFGCQIWYMGHLPFVTENGGFASTYITMTGYHLFHLSLGLIMVLGITVRTFQGRYTPQRMLGIVTIGYYWYWTVALGIIFWVLPIVLPAKL